jgi:hypothetical protein
MGLTAASTSLILQRVVTPLPQARDLVERRAPSSASCQVVAFLCDGLVPCPAILWLGALCASMAMGVTLASHWWSPCSFGAGAAEIANEITADSDVLGAHR